MLFGYARAARGNRQSMRAIGGPLFGNPSRVRRHLESCGGYNVPCTGELVAVRGFPDARCGDVRVRFGFARPTDGLAEPLRVVTGPSGGFPTTPFLRAARSNKLLIRTA